MTGILRVSLAFLVLISHLQLYIAGLNQGVTAVVIFYILAGHVVTFLYLKRFNLNTFKFYIDRFIRIFFIYWFISIIYLIFLIITHFGNPIFTPTNLILNFSLIPVNYYMYLHDLLVILTSTNPPWYLIPPAWSLGAEFQFYLLVPILLKYRRLAAVLFVISILIYSLANLKILQSDYWGYRLLPGTLFIFMFGIYLQRYLYGNILMFEKILLYLGYIYILIWFIIIVCIFHFYGTYTRETMIGILLGIPIVFISLKYRYILHFKFLGNFSYILYLIHFLAIWIIDFLNLNSFKNILIILLSFILSFFLTLMVEKFIEPFRYTAVNLRLAIKIEIKRKILNSFFFKLLKIK
jgi:peptidoglycan/LPS O-acetylase OafA/YrhL